MRLTSAVRISLGLVLLTTSLLLFADLLGFIPDRAEAILEARKKFCESLAVQLTTLAQKSDTATIKSTLNAVVERNSDVISAGMRIGEKKLLAQAGDHEKYWPINKLNNHSTPTHVQIPIFKGEGHWATVEIYFTPLIPQGTTMLLKNPLFRLVGFIGLVGLPVYFLFMRRTLSYLDPSAVIPERVKLAFDGLVEGVVLVDEKDRIVLANAAFAEKVGWPPEQLLGKKASEFPWQVPKTEQRMETTPWLQALQDGKTHSSVGVCLQTLSQGQRTFMVNGAPICDSNGKRRGALATFDDVTALEEKNAQLQEMIEKLELSKSEISHQNKQLEYLATRDPLTGCFNRRFLFEHFKTVFDSAKKQGQALSCIMCDIDHFKAVNDSYGHAVGDEIIKMMASTLQSVCEDYIVGRYGGEEFLVVLPGTTIEKAARIAETCRRSIEKKVCTEVRVTSSFGVSTLTFGLNDPQSLVVQADKALYAAKKNGRNRVIRWDEEEFDCPSQPVSLVTRIAQRR